MGKKVAHDTRARARLQPCGAGGVGGGSGCTTLFRCRRLNVQRQTAAGRHGQARSPPRYSGPKSGQIHLVLNGAKTGIEFPTPSSSFRRLSTAELVKPESSSFKTASESWILA